MFPCAGSNHSQALDYIANYQKERSGERERERVRERVREREREREVWGELTLSFIEGPWHNHLLPLLFSDGYNRARQTDANAFHQLKSLPYLRTGFHFHCTLQKQKHSATQLRWREQ